MRKAAPLQERRRSEHGEEKVDSTVKKVRFQRGEGGKQREPLEDIVSGRKSSLRGSGSFLAKTGQI